VFTPRRRLLADHAFCALAAGDANGKGAELSGIAAPFDGGANAFGDLPAASPRPPRRKNQFAENLENVRENRKNI
jgi:hypothetical protein